MKAMFPQWQPRIDRTEAKMRDIFQFKNREPGLVVVDTNYWTFGDLEAEIPVDYYTDAEVVLRYQLAKINRHFTSIPNDDYVPFLHPWYGTGVLASAFGIKVICNPKADPAVDLATIQEPEQIDELPVPIPGKSGAMPEVVRMIDHFRAHSDLPVVFTDCQGPLATALQVVGYDKFCYWMMDCPEQIHKLMDKVTEALIAWVKFQKLRLGQPLAGESYPLSIKLPAGAGGVWMADDDSVIMPTDLYREFVKPYNEKLLAAFGGGCIHYCGNSTQNIESYASTKGVTAINNFMLDNFEAAAKIRRALRDQGIVYMACDFTPTDGRLDDYFRELTKAMDGSEGLIVGSYIATGIALNKGGYEAINRNRDTLARRVADLAIRYFRCPSIPIDGD